MAQCCLEIGFSVDLCCSGCRLFHNSIPIERRFNLKMLLKKRPNTHKSEKYQCRRPWEIDVDDAVGPQVPMVHEQLHHLSLNPSTLFVSDDEDEGDATETTASLSTGEESAMPAAGEESSSNSDSDTDDGGNSDPPQRRTKVGTATVFSNGEEFVIENVPVTHAVVPKAHLKRLQNKESMINRIRKQYTRKRFPDVSTKTKATIAAVLATVPALALTAAQYFIPAIIASFFLESGLLDYRSFDTLRFAGSFPSEHYFRSILFDQAAMCLLTFSLNLRNKRVFLSCDKGNKKGIGHFVKMLSFWSGESVEFKCLDMDASEGDTNSCADAVEKSLQKVGGVKLQGSTTDSGGGGVLDSLAAALNDRNLCNENYKVAGCTIHTFQLTLKNPIEKVLGDGGLGTRNMMQLIHAVYDMQESLEFQEYLEVMTESVAFTRKLQAGKDYSYGGSKYDDEFKDRMTTVIGFYNNFSSASFFGTKKQIKKMPAPVLTRWWYVGEACKFVWQYYPAILKATQIVINTYTKKPNKIASGLQPLILEHEIFADLSLVYCFHASYFDRHMKWLQSNTDLSGRPGFLSHQMLSRYFIMRRDLERIRRTIFNSHPDFNDYRMSIATADSGAMKEVIRMKGELFITIAIESLEKHFDRWAAPNLLPAALLSEKPLATTVARGMLGVKHPTLDPLKRFFVSTVHTAVIDLKEYQVFVDRLLGVHKEKDDTTADYDTSDVSAAREVLNGLEPRSFLCSKPVSNRTTNYLCEMYLALACHTQGVESAVKEAKLVSPTGRHEALRSAYAIVRSHMVLSGGNLSATAAPERAALILKAGTQAEDDQARQQSSMGHYNYRDTLQSIRRNMNQDHFKLERIGKLKERVQARKEINKKMNAIQKTAGGVDRTVATLGLIAYSSINKNKGHDIALKEELMFRSVSFEQDAGFMELKKKLMEHEVERVKATTESIDTARKAFRRLSNVIFVGVDIDRVAVPTGQEFFFAEDLESAEP